MSLTKWICVLSISIAITHLSHLLFSMQANSVWAKFLRAIFKFRKRKKILPSLVYVHKTWNYAFARRSRAVTAKKCTKKRDARAEVLFCLFSLLIFWRSRCHRRRGILKSRMIQDFQPLEVNITPLVGTRTDLIYPFHYYWCIRQNDHEKKRSPTSVLMFQQILEIKVN